MNRSTKTLLWILLGLVLFAAGYLAFGIYYSVLDKQIQSQSPPVAPHA